MNILLLGQEEHARIDAAIQAARANPVPWSAMTAIAQDSPTTTLMLGDRMTGVKEVRRQYPSQHVMLGGYRAAISFEEQPAGLLRHLSLSSNRKGMIPGLEVVQALVIAFGFSGFPLQRQGRVWMEEFEPGHMAVNIVEAVEVGA